METRTLRQDAQGESAKGSSGAESDAEAATRVELPDEAGVPGIIEDAPHAQAIGAQIDRFVVLEKIGAGGMGAVYAAYDKKLDRKVAVKVLHPERAPSAEAQARMVREARALARLSHPSVVSIYDVGTHEGQVYLAMEFVDGQTLREWLNAERPDWRTVVRVFLRLADGLQGIHELGLVHRDFKPDNVLVNAKGRPRLIDFGLARRAGEAETSISTSGAPEETSVDERLTVTGALIGTPRYMAPEQFEREPATAASDQFAFCVALYEAVFRVSPFSGDSVETRAASVLRDQVRDPPKRRGTPKELLGVLRRGLVREPDGRWLTMDELAVALRRILEAYDAELDDPAARRGRRLTMVTLALIICLGPGSASALNLAGMLNITPIRLAIGDLAFSSLVIVGLVVLRRHWLGARLGRRLAALAMTLSVLFTAQDVAGWLTGRAAPESSLANLIALTVLALFASVLTNTALLYAAGWAALMSVIAISDPVHSFAYLNLGVLGTVIITWALTPKRAGVGWMPAVLGSTLSGTPPSSPRSTSDDSSAP